MLALAGIVWLGLGVLRVWGLGGWGLGSFGFRVWGVAGSLSPTSRNFL